MRKYTSIDSPVWTGMILVLWAGLAMYSPIRSQSTRERSPPAVPPLRFQIFLIGDAGDSEEGEPVLRALGERAAFAPDRSLILFLGDNLYPNGMTDPRDPILTARLTRQVEMVRRSGARAVFLPGNHDWAEGADNGQLVLAHQQAFVDSALGPGHFLPKDGCPGPIKLALPGIQLVLLDTQWWLQEVRDVESCEHKTEEEVLRALDNALVEGDSLPLLVAGHHPLESNGVHGGYFNWRDWWFPLTRVRAWAWLPVPALYPMFRKFISPSPQDLHARRYAHMRESLNGVLAAHPPAAYASGHEHSLQVMSGRSGFTLLISGLGSSLNEGETSLRRTGNLNFGHLRSGFMIVESLPTGELRLEVLSEDARSLFATPLN